MEYKSQHIAPGPKMKPRLVIHGGAGNILRQNYPADKYGIYRSALLGIVSETHEYMTSTARSGADEKSHRPSALDIATFAVTQLENNPLFNSGHGAVFTRDGVNELEASVMVSRGFKKRGVGVMGLRKVRNPIVLAKKMLEHGEQDLAAHESHPSLTAQGLEMSTVLDIPSAQGHSQIHGEAAETLAQRYGVELVDSSYFFTQQRWDEHVRALDREQSGEGMSSWHAGEYLPQGTCGAVALDEDGVICAATSTGGLTNKLTGRIGDTPSLGAGFWAEEWTEDGDPTGQGTGRNDVWSALRDSVAAPGPLLSLSGSLKGLVADCLPTPTLYQPLMRIEPPAWWQQGGGDKSLTTTRSMAASGTGNGDSFLRTNAVRSVAAMARWKPETSASALTHITGPGGELQKSAGDRWKKTGEGEGGMIGIECAVVRDAHGRIVDTRSDVLMDFNCGGMFRAWIDDNDEAVMSIWSNGSIDSEK